MKAKVFGAAGAVLMALGLVVGLIPVSSGGADCGSVISPEGALAIALTAGESAANSCESLLSVLAIPTWVLAGLGVASLAVAFFVATSNPKDDDLSRQPDRTSR